MIDVSRYSQYFERMVKNNGVPNLTEKDFRRYMNIVYLEGYYSALRELGTAKEYNSIEVYKNNKLLYTLTKGLPPEKLYFKMTNNR